MEKLKKILEREIAQRELALKHNPLNKVEIEEELKELQQGIVKLFAIPDVVWQSEQAGVCMHNLDMTGKCFKCGEQYIRKEG